MIALEILIAFMIASDPVVQKISLYALLNKTLYAKFFSDVSFRLKFVEQFLIWLNVFLNTWWLCPKE